MNLLKKYCPLLQVQVSRAGAGEAPWRAASGAVRMAGIGARGVDDAAGRPKPACPVEPLTPSLRYKRSFYCVLLHLSVVQDLSVVANSRLKSYPKRTRSGRSDGLKNSKMTTLIEKVRPKETYPAKELSAAHAWAGLTLREATSVG